MKARCILGLLAVMALAAYPAVAQNVYQGLPAPLQRVAFEQNLGDKVDLGLEFVDHNGAAVRLGDLVGERPVIVAPVYYDCPMLCSMTMSGLVASLRAVDMTVGRDFDVVVFTIDPEETTELDNQTTQTPEKNWLCWRGTRADLGYIVPHSPLLPQAQVIPQKD